MKEWIKKLEKTPLSERIKSNPTTYSILRNAAKQYGNRIALQYVPSAQNKKIAEEYSFNSLFERVNQIGHMLLSHGVQNKSVVTLYLPTMPESITVLTAVEAVGIGNPISPALPDASFNYLLDLTKSTVLITTDALWENIKACQKTAQFEKIFIIGEIKNSSNKKFIPFKSYLDYPLTDLEAENSINPNRICALFHTSGTTDKPKLATLTHHGKVFSAWAVATMCGYTDKDVIHGALPYFHVGAPTLAGTAAFLKGAKIIQFTPFGWMDPEVTEHFWENVEHFGITSVAGLSFHYTNLIQNYTTQYDCHTLRHALSGMALNPGDHKKFKEYTGIPVQVIYGCTESACIVSSNHYADDSERSSMGRPYPYTDMKTVILDNRGNYVRDCTVNEKGYICVRGPGITKGYIPEDTNQEKFIADGWLNTGDIGYESENGYFHFVCRSTEMVIGCDPTASEKALLSHPDIQQAAIIGKPDVSGEIPVAYVSLRQNTVMTLNGVREYLNQQHNASTFILPNELEIRDSLQTNGMGKIIKFLLQQDAIIKACKQSILSILKITDDALIMEFEHRDEPHSPLNIQINALQEIPNEQTSLIQNSLDNLHIHYNLKWNIVESETASNFTP